MNHYMHRNMIIIHITKMSKIKQNKANKQTNKERKI